MRTTLLVLKRTAIVLTAVIIITASFIYFYMQKETFGSTPSASRLERIQRSPNFREGQFRNINHTPEITEGYSMLGVAFEFFFKTIERRTPADTIPSVKNDLLHLAKDQDVLVWFGHSSYFIQIDGKRILVDPVFSGNASPVPGTNRSFSGTDRYTVDDLPEIDYLFISHDHYDHVDLETLKQLKPKVQKVFCGLGVGAHFERWGYDMSRVMEMDWNESADLGSGFVVHATPARHFSGRSLSRNNTLWMSYVVQTPTMKFYIGGDSGYDTFFKQIGEKHGPIDLVMLDDGQYDVKWKYIHMLPEEVIPAAKDLKAKRLFPVHNSKFALGNHAWDEPLRKITELNEQEQIPLVTPIIGELVRLKDTTQQFTRWWVGIK
jgi:L-ascorbate metabolism protein UlaG (beta-lactamase superfamily)